MTRLRSVSLLLVTAVVATIGLFASPAAADPGDGVCDAGELCLWYHPSYTGSRGDMETNDSGTHATCPPPNAPPPISWWGDCSHYNNFFVTAGNGQGLRMLNEAASAYNRWNYPVRIYSSKLCIGSYYTLAAHRSTPDLGALRNNNESHCWYGW